MFNTAPSADHPLSVSQLGEMIKEILEAGFPTVYLRGEISGFKQAASGHCYFQLKDANHVIRSVMWRNTAGRVNFALEDGLDVIVRGSVTTWGGSSNYQLKVADIQLAGQGQLAKLIEERKAKLAAEGLFDAERKRPIPLLPARIGLITSPTGAVIDDMQRTIARRCPRHLVFTPAAVQGQKAVPELLAGLATLNALPGDKRPEVILLARGGGSLEDLMAFNDEALVRAVANSTVPVITGVGHEPDVTLVDYAADQRAPTPTAAAELATPDRTELLNQLDATTAHLTRLLRTKLERGQQHLDAWQGRLVSPQKRLTEAKERLAQAAKTLHWLMQSHLNKHQQRLALHEAKLLGLNPEAPLRRGFALVTNATGKAITSANSTETAIQLRFADGIRHAQLTPQ